MARPNPLRREIPSAVRQTVERARSALGDRNATVDYDWLRTLSGASSEAIADTLSELEEWIDVEGRIRRIQRSSGRSYFAQFRAPFELYALVRLLRPDHIIETGVSSGVSSTHFLLGLRKNRRGTLHSIDLPIPQRSARFSVRESPVALPPGHASGWAVPATLRNGWDLRIGSSRSLLPGLVSELRSIGIFLHDSRHTPSHLRFELETVRPKLRSGAVVIADNTVWTGLAFPRFARSVGAVVRRRRRSDLVALTVP